MALRLRATGGTAGRLGERTSQAFGVHGGRIGRAPDNDWVLPDPERWVSGYHAEIEHRAGAWLLVDRSSNGTFVNGAVEPLGRGQSHVLRDGDRVRIGDYAFVVTISAENDFPPDVSAVMAYDGGTLEQSLAEATLGDLGADLDLGGLLHEPAAPAEPRLLVPPPGGIGGPDAAPRGGGRAGTRGLGAARDDAAASEPPPAPPSRPDAHRFASPPSIAAPVAVEGGRPAAASASASTPAAMVVPLPSPPAAPASSVRAGDAVPAAHWQAFWRAAGLDPTAIPVEQSAAALTLAGQLLRELTLGLMAALQHRGEQKSRFRAADTTIAPFESNPLKLYGSVDEVLARLFHGRATARQLGPLEAVRAGFADLRRHDEAVAAAMQVALAEYLQRLAPRQLELQFDQALQRNGTQPSRTRYWEMYAELYRVLVQGAADGLPQLYAEAFALAYDRASVRLVDAARPGTTAHAR